MHTTKPGKWPRCFTRIDNSDDRLLLAAAGVAAICVIAIVAAALAILLAQPVLR